jgi:hypothetical protein
MLFTLLLLFLQAPAQLNVKAFNDIEIGMPADSVAGALIRYGYAVTRPDMNPKARVVSLNGKPVGSFFVDSDGRVDAAEQQVYSSAGKADDVIEFAEALYWLIHDEGAVIEPNEKDRVSTQTAAVLGTDDFLTRASVASLKHFSIRTKSGALYIISLYRLPSTSVDIVKVAPFPKK